MLFLSYNDLFFFNVCFLFVPFTGVLFKEKRFLYFVYCGSNLTCFKVYIHDMGGKDVIGVERERETE